LIHKSGNFCQQKGGVRGNMRPDSQKKEALF
jgi:hypothetical protein